MLLKAQGRGEGEGSCFYFGKSKLPKGLSLTLCGVLGRLPSTMFTRRDKPGGQARETQNNFRYCYKALRCAAALIGMGQDSENATVPTAKEQ